MMDKEFNPVVSLAMSMIFGSVDGGEVLDGKAETVPVSNKKWFDKYSTDVYLSSLEGESWDSSYWSIIDSILTNPDAKPSDVQVPYKEDSYAVLYDSYYFWIPSEGKRLKVYNDTVTVFEELEVKDFVTGEEISDLSDEVNQVNTQTDNIRTDVENLKYALFGGDRIYGFHIDSSESDPYSAVTYLEDAVDMTPAKMDFTTGKFDYGSWRYAFFMPRPCMLNYDGTVEYYLDPDDYTKKEDGTPSDVSNVNFGGNAMMEWGQNGRKIWYKIVPDLDPTSASVYIASYRADDGYQAWSFINNQGIMVDHFYTPIYNGSLDGSGRLRSLSGIANTGLCQSKTATQEVTAAELNNPSADKLWYTEVYCDITLINLLLVLVGKSLNTQGTFGNGVQGQPSAATSLVGTGTLDNKGLFYGYNDNTHAVKVFGMENWWGNQWRRYAGHVCIDLVNRYKFTWGTEDGSTVTGYVQSTNGSDYNGYLTGITSPSTNGYVRKMTFVADGSMFVYAVGDGASTTKYYSDYWYQQSGVRYCLRGGSANYGAGTPGAWFVSAATSSSNSSWSLGSSLSCKPLSQ